MKVKKVLCILIAVGILSQTSVWAASAHKHVWMDDIEHSDQTTNRYYCECGEVKEENVADVRDYVIRFDANGGGVETKTLETRNNKLRKLPIPYHDSNYQWEGWYTEPDGGELVEENFVYEGDTTLYAHWTVVGTYTLTFGSDGGSYIRPITGLYGTTTDLQSYVPEKEGYLFDGWYSDPRTKVDRVTEYTFNENGVVYAKWIADETKTQPDTIMTTDPIYLNDEQLAERMERLRAIVARLIEMMRSNTK